MEKELTSAFKFKKGDGVCGLYLTGKISELPKSSEPNELFYVVELIDNDHRINGQWAKMHESELQIGTTPHYISEYQIAKSKDISDVERLQTYGELCVGLSVNHSGIDSIKEVWEIKNIFAELIDEIQYQLRVNQRELAIASMNPTDRLAANVSVIDMFKESISDAVLLKSRLVSAAVGNNEKC